MTVFISWGVGAAICGAFGAMTTVLAFYIRATVRDEIRTLEKLFVLRDVYDVRVGEIDRRFENLEQHVAWKA